jgi:hypothetical protein
VLNEEQQSEIEELAGYFFTEDEVEEISGISKNAQGFKKAFRKGSLIAEAEIRKSIIELAKAGSSPAQTLAWRMLESQKRTEY